MSNFAYYGVQHIILKIKNVYESDIMSEGHY